MSGTAEKNTRKRYRLHTEQGGRCFYCPDQIDALMDGKGSPVLEHFIPRAVGGTKVVLACKPCDKMKGMIPGPEFKAILESHMADDRPMSVVRQRATPECKARNKELQMGHAPREAGAIVTRERTARRAAEMGVVIYSTADAGTSGRNAFVEAFEARKAEREIQPHTGDRHYESWTGRRPA